VSRDRRATAPRRRPNVLGFSREARVELSVEHDRGPATSLLFTMRSRARVPQRPQSAMAGLVGCKPELGGALPQPTTMPSSHAPGGLRAPRSHCLRIRSAPRTDSCSHLLLRYPQPGPLQPRWLQRSRPHCRCLRCTTGARVSRRLRALRSLGTTQDDRRARLLSCFRVLGLHVNFERALRRTRARHRKRCDRHSLVLRTASCARSPRPRRTSRRSNIFDRIHLTDLASAARPALSSPSSTTAGPRRPCCLP
jgi:hypothetical protein